MMEALQTLLRQTQGEAERRQKEERIQEKMCIRDSPCSVNIKYFFSITYPWSYSDCLLYTSRCV